MSQQTVNSFEGKVAFVTGAGTGIGRAGALAFAERGARVALIDREEDAVHAVAREIESAGGTAIAFRSDVSNSEDVRQALEGTARAFGGLDFAFNNAGIEQSKVSLAELGEDEFDRIIANNLRSVFVCMKHEIPLLRARGGGSIVNTSSGAGVVGIKGQSAYAASKHAVIGLSRSAALDHISDGIRVNVICPGIIETAMIMERVSGGTKEGQAEMIGQEPIGRMGRPGEIADAVVFLCSDAASFMVGHAMVVDGGQTAGI